MDWQSLIGDYGMDEYWQRREADYRAGSDRDRERLARIEAFASDVRARCERVDALIGPLWDAYCEKYRKGEPCGN